MTHKFWIALPTALLTTILGTASFTHAQPDQTFDSKLEVLTQTEIVGKTQQAEAETSEFSDLEKGNRKNRRYSSRRSRSGGGMASYYGPGFHGRRSANGERFNQNSLTAAHRSLPFGTKVRVTNLSNRRSVVVRINDRGPFAAGRVIDVSTAAARSLGMTGSGVAPVSIQVVGR